MRARVATATVLAALAAPDVAGAAYPGRDGLIAFTRAVGSKNGQIHIVRPDGSVYDTTRDSSVVSLTPSAC